MNGKKENNLPGDGEKAPGPIRDEKGDHGRQSGTLDAAPAYDAIAYAARIDSIKKLIGEFSVRHLNREYTAFAFNLCDKISITPGLDIMRGRKTIWAASIVHVIARLNFLFDADSEHVLTPALICTHFKTHKSTVSNRATRIQKTCAIEPGARGYCRREIVDAAGLHDTADGFVRPARRSGRPAPAGARQEKQLKLFE